MFPAATTASSTRSRRPGTMSVYVEGMGVATGLAFDHEENLYVGDRSGTIFKISRTRQIYVFTTLEPSIAAYHLAFGPDGYLYVTGPDHVEFRRGSPLSPDGRSGGVLPRAGPAAGHGVRCRWQPLRGGIAAAAAAELCASMRIATRSCSFPGPASSGWHSRPPAPWSSPPIMRCIE